MKIVKLTVENIMRVSAVEITPTGNVVVIGGNNGNGKSSVLTAIEMALGGKDHVVEQPVRLGEEKGRVLIDLGEIQVERLFTQGGTRLVVRAASGAVFQSPQSMLDAFVGKLAFDPLNFARAKDKEQGEILRALVKLDTSDLDQKRSALFSERTVVNREVERLSVSINSLPAPVAVETLPETEPDPAELLKQLDALTKRNEARRAKSVAHTHAVTARINAEDKLRNTEDDIANLRNALAHAEQEHERRAKALIDAKADVARAEAEAQQAASEIESDDELRGRIANCQTISLAIRQRNERAKAIAAYEAKVNEAARLTAEIEAADAAKRERIAALKFPIEGLSFGADSVTLNGLPFSQASSAEQLRASVAIGMALNPKLRVMIVRDGSLLDDNGLKLLGDLAAAADAQVWVERVGKGQEVSFVIEDGHLETT